MAEEKRRPGRPRGKAAAPQGKPFTPEPPLLLQEFCEQLRARDYEPPVEPLALRQWIRERAEPDLFWFVCWIMEYEQERRDKFGQFHRDLAHFLTDFTQSRQKLLLCPMGHLKTTFGSHGLPLHILVQHPERNIYFPGRWGCNQAILLGNENEKKSKDNLGVIKRHLEQNEILRWTWPEIMWEKVKDANRWSDTDIEVRRSVIRPEPSIQAVGAETGFLGYHYDVVDLDDIAGIKAGQSPDLMARCKIFKAGAKSRLVDRLKSIMLGIGTHQSPNDVYVDWLKETTVERMVRSIEENGHPLWPEEYSLEKIELLRSETDPILWSLWYLNKPVASGFSALDWEQLREYRMWGENIVYADNPADEIIERKIQDRKERAFRLGMVPEPQRQPTMREQQMRMQMRRNVPAEFAEHMAWKYPKKAEAVKG